MSYAKPPYDATIENIRLLCEELRDASGMGKEDLEEETDELEGSTFDRTLEAAVRLGLFSESDGEYQATTKGKQIGYGRLSPEDEKELFRDLVSEYEFYRELLKIVGGELTSNNGEQYLERDVVQSEIGINFDFGVGDRTLKSAAGTFLQVLDECGVGKYTRGQGDYPTRLVINEEYSEFLSRLTTEEEPSQDKQSAQEGLPIDDESNSEDSVDSAPSESVESEEDSENHPPQPATVTKNTEITETLEDGSADLTIEIEISSADWDSEEVISVIESVTGTTSE